MFFPVNGPCTLNPSGSTAHLTVWTTVLSLRSIQNKGFQAGWVRNGVTSLLKVGPYSTEPRLCDVTVKTVGRQNLPGICQNVSNPSILR